jgi:cell wall-associated NlpC family hydrolase
MTRPTLVALPVVVLLALVIALLPSAGVAAGSAAAGRRVAAPAPKRAQRHRVRRRIVPLGQRAVLVARHWIGVPYRWGGASPSGFDCSGLVMAAYARLGVSLPHNAAALWNVGRPVARSRLRPGDLLFFVGLGHVAMYVGGGRMIHAPESGDHVRIVPLAGRYGERFIGARRIIRA